MSPVLSCTLAQWIDAMDNKVYRLTAEHTRQIIQGVLTTIKQQYCQQHRYYLFITPLDIIITYVTSVCNFRIQSVTLAALGCFRAFTTNTASDTPRKQRQCGQECQSEHARYSQTVNFFCCPSTLSAYFSVPKTQTLPIESRIPNVTSLDLSKVIFSLGVCISSLVVGKLVRDEWISSLVIQGNKGHDPEGAIKQLVRFGWYRIELDTYTIYQKCLKQPGFIPLREQFSPTNPYAVLFQAPFLPHDEKPNMHLIQLLIHMITENDAQRWTEKEVLNSRLCINSKATTNLILEDSPVLLDNQECWQPQLGTVHKHKPTRTSTTGSMESSTRNILTGMRANTCVDKCDRHHTQPSSVLVPANLPPVNRAEPSLFLPNHECAGTSTIIPEDLYNSRHYNIHSPVHTQRNLSTPGAPRKRKKVNLYNWTLTA
jgi:hypothetical protein